MGLPHVKVMSRRQCCLCEEAKVVVEALSEQGLCSWETVDVDRDKGLLVRYGMDVPVILVDDQPTFKHRVTAGELSNRLQQVRESA